MLLLPCMEPQQGESEGIIVPLKKVTPLSKYLALALFVALPFLGGWVGYVLSPVQVIEVEKPVAVISPEKEVSLPTMSELQSQYKEQVSDNLEIELLYTGERDTVSYFKSFVPNSSACCGIYKYHHDTQKFYDTGITIDIMIGERSSTDGRYVAKVADQIFLEVYDLETQSLVVKKIINDAETLIANTCGYAGYSYDLTWVNNNTLQYGVYKNVDLSEGCPEMELLEHRIINLE